jgi:hypothetical protein
MRAVTDIPISIERFPPHFHRSWNVVVNLQFMTLLSVPATKFIPVLCPLALYTHTHTYTHRLILTNTHTHMRTLTTSHMRTHARTHIHTHTDTHTPSYTHKYSQLCVYRHLRNFIRMERATPPNPARLLPSSMLRRRMLPTLLVKREAALQHGPRLPLLVRHDYTATPHNLRGRRWGQLTLHGSQNHMCAGLAENICTYSVCAYGIFGRDITGYTLICGVQHIVIADY